MSTKKIVSQTKIGIDIENADEKGVPELWLFPNERRSYLLL